MTSLMCCCAPNKEEGSAIVDTSGELNEQQHMAASLQHSARPNFPAPVRSPREGGEDASPRSQRNKDSEKVRLQEIVKDFTKQAVSGIVVNRISAKTGEISQSMLMMDKYLYTLTLRSRTPESEEGEEQCFNMKDMSAIYKGPDFTRKVPSLSHMAAYCVGVEFANNADVNFHFKDTIERDQFYTCLKILRMSVDINTARRR